jgi:hypothetical protein
MGDSCFDVRGSSTASDGSFSQGYIGEYDASGGTYSSTLVPEPSSSELVATALLVLGVFVACNRSISPEKSEGHCEKRQGNLKK